MHFFGTVAKNLLPMQEMQGIGFILGSGTYPGRGNGNPLQYSCLGNPMDGGDWQARVHGVSKSWTQLRTYTHMHFHLD